MKLHALATTGILFITWGLAIGGDADAVKPDMKLLAGDWEIQSFETNGKPLPDGD